MSSDPVITFSHVWKKYSKQQVLNNSLREELISFMTGKKYDDDLSEGEFWALNDVSFTVNKGDCVGVYGPNGSGKSTILKLISNVTYPNKGMITLQGRVAPLIELGAGMHPDLTGYENIYMNGTILGLSVKEIKYKMAKIVEFSGLSDFIQVPVKKYSSGMFLRLAFSIAVHSPADIFLFDEVLSVGDNEFIIRCNDKINDILSREKTIFLVSHEVDLLDKFSSCRLNIVNGRVDRCQV
ncbi:MAG: ABC transporter ATP-binding protein [Desulfobulbus sp.]|jgi:ABC-type polysaccharide/polyol phosphate transport system ATPase subunit|uniref:ABC transporter ATP-binding protein n=1 Tax=Desulfobulbus sp. TaxID=895 RepID=UPI0028411884|nr:ATP-binding cassette domain-containing protein [Desulfobulbus sp.]MDR2550387.1 ABC transporter ATP-binding protein [Desulfobulbus sp.]